MVLAAGGNGVVLQIFYLSLISIFCRGPELSGEAKKESPQVAVHKTGFTKQIIWQLPDKGC